SGGTDRAVAHYPLKVRAGLPSTRVERIPLTLMIQSVDNSSAQASSAYKASTPTANGGASSFATALASAQSKSGQGTITGGLQTDLKPPKGETWRPVDG